MVTGLNAQVSNRVIKQIKSNPIQESSRVQANVNTEKAVEIWSNDCSDDTQWTLANTSVPAQDWVHTTDVTAPPAFGDANMTTAANGYFLIDSDGAGGTAVQNADLTYNGTVDLSTHPNVILEFEQHYRTFEDARTVSVSTDGGTVWTDFVITTNANAEANQNVDGMFQVNISAAAGGHANVMLKFNYQGNWGFHWAIDDIRMVVQPLVDLQLLSSWIAGENNEGIEYGRVPVDQTDANYIFGGQVNNFGADANNNIVLNSDFTSFNSVSNEAVLNSSDTVNMESTEALTLTTGVYDGTFVVTSDEETTGGLEFGNNTYLRSFEVTDNIYSTDGIGVYPASMEDISSYGTSSSSTADGLVMANMYHIKQTSEISGYRIMLSAAAGANVAGGEIYISVVDTANFFNNDMTPVVAASSSHILTDAEITQGYADLHFDNVITLDAGAYFFAVELYSNGNANEITILDDETVAQPSYASMIYVPNDQSWSNGEAFAIRLLMGDTWGVGVEENNLEGVAVYPNPSQGVVTISNDLNIENEITVYNMVGAVVATTNASSSVQMDLSANGTGVYLVKVSNANGSMVERVVIK